MKRSTKKEKKKWKRNLLALAIFLLFCVSPFSKFLLSMGVMSVYSGMHEKESILAEKDVRLQIPSGRGWYPFVMTFNPNSADFCRFAGLPDDAVRLSILYNFPAFDLSRKGGCSRLFDETSPYYNSFYGAYAVSGSSEGEGIPYGFHADGSLKPEEIAKVAKYDFQKLVLGDFGLMPHDRVFTWRTDSAGSKAEDFLGESGWQRVDAELLVNGCEHQANGFVQSYLQYGMPDCDFAGTDDKNKENKRPFTPVEMKGRIYAKYYEKKDLAVFFYIIAADEEVLAWTDEEILRKSKLVFL